MSSNNENNNTSNSNVKVEVVEPQNKNEISNHKTILPEHNNPNPSTQPQTSVSIEKSVNQQASAQPFHQVNLPVSSQAFYNVPQHITPGQSGYTIPSQFIGVEAQKQNIFPPSQPIPAQNVFNQMPTQGSISYPQNTPLPHGYYQPYRNLKITTASQPIVPVHQPNRLIVRKSLFIRYVYLCRYDRANMDKTCMYTSTFLSTTHFFLLVGLCFSPKYEAFVLRGGMKNIIFSTIFFIGNFFIYKSYNRYFLRRSFEKKYRDIDDENLENILKSLEQYRVKAQ